MGRKLSDEATDAELEELDDLFTSDPELQYYADVLATWWKIAEQHGRQQAEDALNKHLIRMASKNLIISKDNPHRR